MKALFFVPIVLSLVVLGAHFMREGSEIGVAVAIVLIGILVLRRAWVARVVQLALVFGAAEWLITLYGLAAYRAARGEPATRMIIILGTVAVVTAASALLFQTKALKETYSLGSGDPADAE